MTNKHNKDCGPEGKAMNQVILSQGVRVINGVEMMGSRNLMSICGVGEHKHFVRDLKVLFSMVKLRSKNSTLVIKGVFVELHEEGPKKGCIKEIWFDTEKVKEIIGTFVGNSRAFSVKEKEDIFFKYGVTYSAKSIPETEFIKGLEEALQHFNLKVERQFQIGKYFVDALIPDAGIVVEFDEPTHQNYDKGWEADRGREIIARGFKIIRVFQSDSIFYNIGKVLSCINEHPKKQDYKLLDKIIVDLFPKTKEVRFFSSVQLRKSFNAVSDISICNIAWDGEIIDEKLLLTSRTRGIKRTLKIKNSMNRDRFNSLDGIFITFKVIEEDVIKKTIEISSWSF